MIVLKKGVKLKEFVLEDQIGTGGSAVVWKAVDTHLNRDVAIKRPLRRGQSLSPEELNQFREEAQRGAKLIHTNIVQVYQIIPEDDDIFLVLEYVDGMSLWDELRQNALNSQNIPLEQSISVLREILSGLAFAHAQGICHRDLKPANILLTKSRIPKIADLGIARVIGTGEEQEGSSQKQGGTGTPDFMSPEQARGEDADFSSDLFMMGITGYLLLSGRHPYSHPSGLFQIDELLRDDDYLPQQLKPPSHLAASDARLYREYAAVVMRLLERERTSRYGSAKEANQALAAVSPFLDCPSCGSRVPESSRFCSQCGERLGITRRMFSMNWPEIEKLSDTAKDANDQGYQLRTYPKIRERVLFPCVGRGEEWFPFESRLCLHGGVHALRLAGQICLDARKALAAA